jgi:hypothetical protein
MIKKSHISRNNDSTQNQSFSQTTQKDLMTEERLQFRSPNEKRSPPPSRDVSPAPTDSKQSDLLLGATNGMELYLKVIEENGKLK